MIVLAGWFMSFSIIVFIPLDIYLNQKYLQVDPRTGNTNGMLYDWWLSSYWSSYLINWLVIPILQQYVVAGEFGMTDKVYRAIVSNVPYYIMYTFSFVGLLILLFIIDNRNDNDINILDTQGILAVIIALSLAFGFLLLVCLLGYALVKIPLSFWMESSFERKLPRLLFKISVYEDKIIDQ